jgi:hypothetical protein
MDATQHCGAAREHSRDALAQIKSAADTVSEQQTQMNGIINDLGESLALVFGTVEDAVTKAAGHMVQVHEKVGSHTAEEIAGQYARVGQLLGQDPISGLKAAVDLLQKAFTACQGVVNSLDVDITELASLNDRVEQLAAQLGA